MHQTLLDHGVSFIFKACNLPSTKLAFDIFTSTSWIKFTSTEFVYKWSLLFTLCSVFLRKCVCHRKYVRLSQFFKEHNQRSRISFGKSRTSSLPLAFYQPLYQKYYCIFLQFTELLTFLFVIRKLRFFLRTSVTALLILFLSSVNNFNFMPRLILSTLTKCY